MCLAWVEVHILVIWWTKLCMRPDESSNKIFNSVLDVIIYQNYFFLNIYYRLLGVYINPHEVKILLWGGVVVLSR